MSIPPLVCSTPPPPDQCEDDKDPEDFDLSYNLSQEEDDENNDYNYTNFSSYNHYQSASIDKPLEIKDQVIKSIDSEVHNEFIHNENSKETEQSNASCDVIETNDINENKLKCEEDMNIEDLNLKVDDTIVTVITDNGDENDSSDQNDDSIKDFNIPSNSNHISQDNDITNMSSYTNVIDPTNHFKESHIDIDETAVEKSNDVKTRHDNDAKDVDISNLQNKDEFPLQMENTLSNTDEYPEEFQQSLKEFESNDDDFGDFDDFQFVNSKNNVTSVVDSSNPWENIEINESDFGNFTANFEENKFPIQDSSPSESGLISNRDQHENQVREPKSNLEDDEFEDFDDFKSSTVKMESSETQEVNPCQDLPVLNLQSTDNEHHIMESITKVLTSVFIEEIAEPDIEFEGKLETLLGETWGHLMETDEREPYIVNWNNSLGQKTLLKALCIDSRNILFGPKWSTHTPKYAANLSNAPLQPQKQASATSYVSQSEIVADKVASKPTTWSDPFTSDGQESCNPENENSTITPRPTDLDVFEAAMSNKSGKIYSNILSVQPIRQINLPDTHIFTPTDSEIPRSKTIHYDRGPTVLLPQPIVADSKNLTDDSAIQNVNSIAKTGTEDDNEYWEFQDFKSTSDSSSLPGLVSRSQIPQEKNFETATTVNALPKSNIAYQTQLLQPIKVEPSKPTLNWPDPGEVKVAYDDFSEFVSVTSQSPDKQDSVILNPPESQTGVNNIKSDNYNDLNEKSVEVSVEAMNTENEDFEDDFDNFQSAAPSKNAPYIIKTNINENSANQMSLSRFTDFDYTSSKINMSDTISSASISKPNEALTQNVGYNSSIVYSSELTNNKSSLSSGTQIQTSFLQPTPANSSAMSTQNQRTPGQILQPLSLESYSQINWPSPGIDLQDLSRFNPVENLQSLKSDLSVSGASKVASPVHTQKTTVVNHVADDDVWGEFVSSKPKQQKSLPKKTPVFAEDDEWTDFISSPSVKPQNGLNTISLNVHTNSNIQKTVQNKFSMKTNPTPVDIPTLNYITPKSNSHKSYNDKHFQNL